MALRDHLLAQDLIYVGGGSLVNLLAVWEAHDIGLDPQPRLAPGHRPRRPERRRDVLVRGRDHQVLRASRWPRPASACSAAASASTTTTSPSAAPPTSRRSATACRAATASTTTPACSGRANGRPSARHRPPRRPRLPGQQPARKASPSRRSRPASCPPRPPRPCARTSPSSAASRHAQTRRLAGLGSRYSPAAGGAVGSAHSSPRLSRAMYSSASSRLSFERSTTLSRSLISATSSTCSLTNHCRNCSAR